MPATCARRGCTEIVFTWLNRHHCSDECRRADLGGERLEPAPVTPSTVRPLTVEHQLVLAQPAVDASAEHTTDPTERGWLAKLLRRLFG
ncbi:hypothetical protein [Amycolatopsis sp. YIM 10]|uniref:hypothetical protein n=1 Tax=Amycolatopsis sp. YIM 10 TaxID=2653857 RepID=UPI0012902CFF|nr:hypothetical protein [Amycolatopsis sp. YIM 10]QFU87855.1 hypothetical protein YIM_13345 [Amycolatopsis sp. YIM 10]QFU94832.1 hypothetical protein YIM_48535 [Amycolatopsis sp. YIM 10]